VLIRISRFLARAGVASRRHVDDLVSQGRVTINGRRAVLGQKVDPEKDTVCVDGQVMGTIPELVYVMLDKPPGYLSSCSDPRSTRTVISLIRHVKARVFPVGRLDFDSDGLLLLTNDGDLTYLLTHPKHQVVKEYVVWVSGPKDRRKLHEMLSGILIDGRKAQVDYAEFVDDENYPGIDPGTGTTGIRIGVHEGRKHLVKRICRAVGYSVLRLTRTKIGSLSLGRLPQGEWRYLSDCEVRSLYRDVRRSYCVARR
jgi:23S rRNA pseudouridine2605 synthase